MKVLATVNSSSGNGTYGIREGDDGVVYCTCKGWRYYGTCTHLRRWIANHEPVVINSPEAGRLLAAIGVS